MFGVRIWFTPMNKSSSPALSLRFVWFSPTLFGMPGTLPPGSLMIEHRLVRREVQRPFAV